MDGGPPLRAELLEGVVQLDERRVRVQREIRTRALAVVVPCNISLGRPVRVGESRLTFEPLRPIKSLAMALVLDVGRPVQRREQRRQHSGENAHCSRLGGVHDGRELCVAAAAEAA